MIPQILLHLQLGTHTLVLSSEPEHRHAAQNKAELDTYFSSSGDFVRKKGFLPVLSLFLSFNIQLNLLSVLLQLSHMEVKCF